MSKKEIWEKIKTHFPNFKKGSKTPNSPVQNTDDPAQNTDKNDGVMADTKGNKIVDVIKTFRRKLARRCFLWNILRFIVVALCVSCIAFITGVLLGWCDNYKVNEDVYGILLIFFILLLILVTGYVSYRMVESRSRYRCALTRIDLLMTRLQINKEKDTEISNIDHELQLVVRILETSTNNDINL